MLYLSSWRVLLFAKKHSIRWNTNLESILYASCLSTGFSRIRPSTVWGKLRIRLVCRISICNILNISHCAVFAYHYGVCSNYNIGSLQVLLNCMVKIRKHESTSYNCEFSFFNQLFQLQSCVMRNCQVYFNVQNFLKHWKTFLHVLSLQGIRETNDYKRIYINI